MTEIAFDVKVADKVYILTNHENMQYKSYTSQQGDYIEILDHYYDQTEVGVQNVKAARELMNKRQTREWNV